MLAVASLKGGTGKTTAAAHTGQAAHELGLRVLGIDADPQASLFGWHSLEPFPWPVVCVPSARLHREIPGIAGEDRYDVVVVDTPPQGAATASSVAGEHNGRAITLSAVRAATCLLVPMAPTPIEYRQMRPLRQLLAEAGELRPDEQVPPCGVLLVKTRAGAASTEAYRGALVASGWRVLRGSAPLRERFAQSFGERIVGAHAGPYGDAVTELLELPAIRERLGIDDVQRIRRGRVGA